MPATLLRRSRSTAEIRVKAMGSSGFRTDRPPGPAPSPSPAISRGEGTLLLEMISPATMGISADRLASRVARKPCQHPVSALSCSPAITPTPEAQAFSRARCRSAMPAPLEIWASMAQTSPTVAPSPSNAQMRLASAAISAAQGHLPRLAAARRRSQAQIPTPVLPPSAPAPCLRSPPRPCPAMALPEKSFSAGARSACRSAAAGGRLPRWIRFWAMPPKPAARWPSIRPMATLPSGPLLPRAISAARLASRNLEPTRLRLIRRTLMPATRPSPQVSCSQEMPARSAPGM